MSGFGQPVAAEADRRPSAGDQSHDDGALAARFESHLHDERVAAILGISLGIAFSVCFATGLLSHYHQQQTTSLFTLSPRPAGLYRVTQGLHVLTGVATIPLLLAKLWTVLPKFFAWPFARSVAQAIHRLALLPLVAGSLYLLFSGLGNIARWRPWQFDFTSSHYWVAWITVGAMLVHLGARGGVARRALKRGRRARPEVPGSISRRGFVGTVFGTSALLTVAVAGQTVRPLRGISVLAPRDPQVGPQGVPVNRTAAQARVTNTARRSDWVLTVEHPGGELRLDAQQLRDVEFREAELPIACVEGWSAGGTWGGVPVRALLELVDAPVGATATVISMQESRRFTRTTLNARQARDADALLALELNGEPLHIDHGFPCRLIAPNMPGVLQTKWLERVVIR